MWKNTWHNRLSLIFSAILESVQVYRSVTASLKAVSASVVISNQKKKKKNYLSPHCLKTKHRALWQLAKFPMRLYVLSIGHESHGMRMIGI